MEARAVRDPRELDAFVARHFGSWDEELRNSFALAMTRRRPAADPDTVDALCVPSDAAAGFALALSLPRPFVAVGVTSAGDGHAEREQAVVDVLVAAMTSRLLKSLGGSAPAGGDAFTLTLDARFSAAAAAAFVRAASALGHAGASVACDMRSTLYAADCALFRPGGAHYGAALPDVVAVRLSLDETARFPRVLGEWIVHFDEDVFGRRLELGAAFEQARRRAANKDAAVVVLLPNAAPAARAASPLPPLAGVADRDPRDGAALAMAWVSGRTASTARLGMVFTPRDLRGRGYGREVTRAACRLASCELRALGDGGDMRSVTLLADEANPGSNAMYKSLGFAPVTSMVMLGARTGAV